MSADDTVVKDPSPVPEGTIMLSQEDYQRLSTAMIQYKEIEMKYLAMRNTRALARRVLATYVIADIVLFFALWLNWYDWEAALAWAAVAFAAEEALMATCFLVPGAVRAT